VGGVAIGCGLTKAPAVREVSQYGTAENQREKLKIKRPKFSESEKGKRRLTYKLFYFIVAQIKPL